MSKLINITIESARKLNTKTEMQLLQEAVRKNPHSASLRLRLTRLLNTLDRFTESIELLTQSAAVDNTLGEKFALMTAYFARNSIGDNELAQLTAESAIQLATTEVDRSLVLGDLAKAHLRQGKNDEAVALLEEALQLNPANGNAFKRLALELLHRQQPLQVIVLTDTLKQKGVCHSRLLVARMMAFAASGKTDVVQKLLGASQFIYARQIQTPSSQHHLAAFNAALAFEIRNNPGMRFERYGTSSKRRGGLIIQQPKIRQQLARY